MMAYCWTNPEADCTVVSTEPPADGFAFVEVDPGTDPGDVYVSADGTLLSVPPRPGPGVLFSPVAGAWIDPRSDAECLAELRRRRDSLLRASDWTQAMDAPLTSAVLDAWRAYRRALRDLPATTLDPRNPQWPLPPAE